MELNTNMYASFTVLNLNGEYNFRDMYAQTDVSHVNFHEAFIEQITKLTKDRSTHDAVHDHCNLVIVVLNHTLDQIANLQHHFNHDFKLAMSRMCRIINPVGRIGRSVIYIHNLEVSHGTLEMFIDIPLGGTASTSMTIKVRV